MRTMTGQKTLCLKSGDVQLFANHLETGEEYCFDSYTQAARWIIAEGISRSKNERTVAACVNNCANPERAEKMAYGFTWELHEVV